MTRDEANESSKRLRCADCGHLAHSGCGQCDAGIPQTPNGWNGGHAVHGFTPEQLLCSEPGCGCEWGGWFVCPDPGCECERV